MCTFLRTSSPRYGRLKESSSRGVISAAAAATAAAIPAAVAARAPTPAGVSTFLSTGPAPGRPAPGWSPLAPCSGAAAAAGTMIDPFEAERTRIQRSQAATQNAGTHASRERRAPSSMQRPQSSFAAAAGSWPERPPSTPNAAAGHRFGALSAAATTTTANRSAGSGDRRGREENLPPHFFCPITQELMEEPVVTQDGQTYERHAIEYWLRDHDTSPLTGQPLAHKELTANIVLRSMIREHYERQPGRAR